MANPGSAAEVEQYLKGVNFPASKQDLISTARSNGVPENMISILENLPGDTFNSPVDVMKAFGEAINRAQKDFWSKGNQ